MTANVWVTTEASTAEAQTGDTVVMPAGGVVKVGEVLDGGDIAWRADVSPDLLPGLPAVDGGAQRVDDEDLLRAVRGVLTAENNRGG